MYLLYGWTNLVTNYGFNVSFNNDVTTITKIVGCITAADINLIKSYVDPINHFRVYQSDYQIVTIA